MWAHYSHTKTV